jgi:hypothetical protein
MLWLYLCNLDVTLVNSIHTAGNFGSPMHQHCNKGMHMHQVLRCALTCFAVWPAPADITAAHPCAALAVVVAGLAHAGVCKQHKQQ